MFVVVVRIYYLLKVFKVLCLMTSIGIEKSIDTSGIDKKVLGNVSKSIFTVSPTTNELTIILLTLLLKYELFVSANH